MSQPTVVLYVRIPVELRDQLDHVVLRDRSSLQRVVTALLSNALTPAASRVVRGPQKTLPLKNGKRVRK